MKTIERHVLTWAQVSLIRQMLAKIRETSEWPNTLSDLDEVLNTEIHGPRQTVYVEYDVTKD